MSTIKQAACKVMIVGEGATGKTCMLEVFRSGKFPSEYVPTIVDNFIKETEVDNQKITLAIWDTSGQESYSAVRTIAYSDTEIVIMCYSVEDKNSLEALKTTWVPEIKNYCPSAEIILVALKCDLRDGSDNFVSTKQGEEVKEEVDAKSFVECSAIRNFNIDLIFTESAKIILKKRQNVYGNKKWYFCYCL
ncbi:hypothetical protein GVAV_002570 [Gurleya vavrai]